MTKGQNTFVIIVVIVVFLLVAYCAKLHRENKAYRYHSSIEEVIYGKV